MAFGANYSCAGSHRPVPPVTMPSDLCAARGLVRCCLETTLDMHYAYDVVRGPEEAIRRTSQLQDLIRDAHPLVDALGLELKEVGAVTQVLFRGQSYANAFAAGISFPESVLHVVGQAVVGHQYGPLDFPTAAVATQYPRACRKLRRYLHWFDLHEVLRFVSQQMEMLTAARRRIEAAEEAARSESLRKVAGLEAHLISLEAQQTKTYRAVKRLGRTHRHSLLPLTPGTPDQDSPEGFAQPQDAGELPHLPAFSPSVGSDSAGSASPPQVEGYPVAEQGLFPEENLLDEIPPPPLPQPRWDSDKRELWYGETLCRRFKRVPPNQAKILEAFHEEGWPQSIADPLPPGKLADTMGDLQAGLRDSPITFERDGTGEGILWRKR